MKKITILLYIALACGLLACERQRIECIDPHPPEPFFEDPTPTPPSLVILYPNYVTENAECYETVDMPIEGVEAFNSITRPEVILKITGYHSNGCVNGIESRAYHQIDGNTITVWATKHVAVVSNGGCEFFCTDEIVPIGFAIYIGTLEAGEYRVVSQSGEQLLTFHTDNLENMTAYDCYPDNQYLPDGIPPDVDPVNCRQYK